MIRAIRHKGLKRLFEQDDPSGVNKEPAYDHEEPAAPRPCCVTGMYRASGLDHHASSRSAWSDAQHAFGTRKREARHISRNGREALEGFRRQRRKLACATGSVRPCASAPRQHKAETAATGLSSLPCPGVRALLCIMPLLPPCAWCKHPATVRREHRGWVAGCNNSARAAGPRSDCLVYPHTTMMTTRAAAVRAWRAAFRKGREPRPAASPLRGCMHYRVSWCPLRYDPRSTSAVQSSLRPCHRNTQLFRGGAECSHLFFPCADVVRASFITDPG